jgi:hypothetical protein
MRLSLCHGRRKGIAESREAAARFPCGPARVQVDVFPLGTKLGRKSIRKSIRRDCSMDSLQQAHLPLPQKDAAR